MKKRSIAAILSALLAAALVLPSCLPISYTSARSGPPMWIIENKEGVRAYLFGTVHTARDAGMFPFADVIEDAYSYCDAVAVECFPDASYDGSVFDLADGSLITDHISKTVYDRAVSAIVSHEGSYNGEYDGKNAAFWYSLTDGYISLDNGYSSEFGSDRYFYEKAVSDGKKTVEMEGTAKQAEYLLRVDDSVYEYFIISAQNSRGSAGMDYYNALYLSGDVEAFEYSLSSGRNASYRDQAFAAKIKDYYDMMYTERNRALADSVAELMSSGERVFFAVNVSHVIGEDGIVAVLRSEGYKVVRK